MGPWVMWAKNIFVTGNTHIWWCSPSLGHIRLDFTVKMANRWGDHLKDNDPDSTQAGFGNQYSWAACRYLLERLTRKKLSGPVIIDFTFCLTIRLVNWHPAPDLMWIRKMYCISNLGKMLLQFRHIAFRWPDWSRLRSEWWSMHATLCSRHHSMPGFMSVEDNNLMSAKPPSHE